MKSSKIRVGMETIEPNWTNEGLFNSSKLIIWMLFLNINYIGLMVYCAFSLRFLLRFLDISSQLLKPCISALPWSVHYKNKRMVWVQDQWMLVSSSTSSALMSSHCFIVFHSKMDPRPKIGPPELIFRQTRIHRNLFKIWTPSEKFGPPPTDEPLKHNSLAKFGPVVYIGESPRFRKLLRPISSATHNVL